MAIENEIINHRERSLKTLNDKDRELNQLRAQVYSSPANTPEVSGGGSMLHSVNDELSERMENSAHMVNYWFGVFGEENVFVKNI